MKRQKIAQYQKSLSSSMENCSQRNTYLTILAKRDKMNLQQSGWRPDNGSCKYHKAQNESPVLVAVPLSRRGSRYPQKSLWFGGTAIKAGDFVLEKDKAMSEILSPCIFCDNMSLEIFKYALGYKVWCGNCEHYQSGPTVEEAVQEWNSLRQGDIWIIDVIKETTDDWVDCYQKPENQSGPCWRLIAAGYMPDLVDTADPRVISIVDKARSS